MNDLDASAIAIGVALVTVWCLVKALYFFAGEGESK